LFAISGGDDLGIAEVQEAAQIITESVDPNARIIFGTIRDERLGKGEIKITVIATGFLSTNSKNTFPRPVASVQQSQTITEESKSEIEPVKEEKKEINNSLQNDYLKTKEKKTETIILDDFDDDTDDWSAVPAFLRRSKK